MLPRGGYYIFIRAPLYGSSGFIKCWKDLFGLYQLPQTDLRNPGQVWAGRGMFVGMETATRRGARFTRSLERDRAVVSPSSPLFYPPLFCSDGRAQVLCCLSLCFSTYEESPAQNNVPLGRKRCFGGGVSFAAIGEMGFGALIRR